jgi:hypothetical protein
MFQDEHVEPRPSFKLKASRGTFSSLDKEIALTWRGIFFNKRTIYED